MHQIEISSELEPLVSRGSSMQTFYFASRGSGGGLAAPITVPMQHCSKICIERLYGNTTNEPDYWRGCLTQNINCPLHIIRESLVLSGSQRLRPKDSSEPD